MQALPSVDARISAMRAPVLKEAWLAVEGARIYRAFAMRQETGRTVGTHPTPQHVTSKRSRLQVLMDTGEGRLNRRARVEALRRGARGMAAEPKAARLGRNLHLWGRKHAKEVCRKPLAGLPELKTDDPTRRWVNFPQARIGLLTHSGARS